MDRLPSENNELEASVETIRALVPASQRKYRGRVAALLEEPAASRPLASFLADPTIDRLFLDLRQPKPRVRFTRGPGFWSIDRTEFLPAFLERLRREHPADLGIDTHGADHYLKLAARGKRTGNASVANIEPYRRAVLDFVRDHGSSLEPGANAVARMSNSPFLVCCGCSQSLLKRPHCESDSTVIAAVIAGSGRFSYPTKGRWQTLYGEEGFLCIEPPGGIHAGEGRGTMALLAVVCPASRRHAPREGVTAVDLSATWSAPATEVYADPDERVFATVLRVGPAASVPVLPEGVYYVHRVRPASRLSLASGRGGSAVELVTGDVVTTKAGGARPSLSMESGKGRRAEAVILAVTHEPMLNQPGLRPSKTRYP